MNKSCSFAIVLALQSSVACVDSAKNVESGPGLDFESVSSPSPSHVGTLAPSTSAGRASTMGEESTDCQTSSDCWLFVPWPDTDWGGVMMPVLLASCDAYDLWEPSQLPRCFTWTAAFHPTCMTPEMLTAEGGNPDGCAPCGD